MIGAAAALGLISAGLNTVQSIQSQKAMKQAAQARSQAQQQLKQIKEFNAFKQVQVPTLGFDLAQQSQAQATTQAMQALQGAGAAGVIGGVGNVLQATNLAAGEQAAKLGELKLQRDINEAEFEQGIQQRQAERDFALESYNLQMAQEQENQAKQNRNEAIKGAVGALGGAALGAYENSALYKNKGTNFNVGDTASQGQPGYGVLSNENQPTSQNNWNWLLQQP